MGVCEGKAPPQLVSYGFNFFLTPNIKEEWKEWL